MSLARRQGVFFVKKQPDSSKQPRGWSGPTQLPYTRSEQPKQIERWLHRSHGGTREKEPRHPVSGEQAVPEIQARALGPLVAFESGGEGKLRLLDCEMVYIMTKCP